MGSNPSQPYFYLEGIIMSDSNQEAELFFKDLFDFSDVPLYDFIREYSAINLILLIRHCGYDRKTLAKELKMKPKHLNKPIVKLYLAVTLARRRHVTDVVINECKISHQSR